MRLLVSAADADDAREAVLGGADIVDAKDPSAGALGAVSLVEFARIRAAVPDSLPVSAALGEQLSADNALQLAGAFADAGAAFVKLGWMGNTCGQARSLVQAAVRGVAEASHPACLVVVAAFAEHLIDEPARLGASLMLARDAGASGLLIDTIDKEGPRLPDLVCASTLVDWASAAHQAGLFVALAGGLVGADMWLGSLSGVDIVGVRSAACVGGRTGTVDRHRVAALRAACGAATDSSPVLDRRRLASTRD